MEFWFTCDEEIGGKDGALWLAQDGHLKGDVCIIGDSSWSASKLSIDLGCKGALRPKITARGVTAHGARPYLGDNAIEKLISVISHVKRIEDYRLRVPPELESVIKSSIELLLGEPDLTERQREAVRHSYHYPTVSLNIMQAGVKVNVVPDTAEAIFDIRLTPGTRMDEVRERLLELVNEADVPGIDIEMDMVSDVAGYYEVPNSFFVAQLSDAVEMATGTRPAFRILSGGTDAIPIKKYSGIPCLGFGGAVEGQAHVPNEYVTIDSLVTAAKAYAIFPLKYNNSLS